MDSKSLRSKALILFEKIEQQLVDMNRMSWPNLELTSMAFTDRSDRHECQFSFERRARNEYRISIVSRSVSRA